MMTAVDWLSIVRSVQETIDRAYPARAKRPAIIADLAQHVVRATTAWPLCVDYASGVCERRGDLLSAPLYTSADFPWPRLGERWCEPVAQIDLARWGVMGGRDVGQGLLQLWEARTGGLIRVIPLDALTAPMTPPPSDRSEDYPSAVRSDMGDQPQWLERPGRIVGYDAPVFDLAAWHLRQDLYRAVEGEGDDLPAPLIERFRTVLEMIGEPDPSDRHRAFGMCRGNIFETAENLPPVLLTIESDDEVYDVMGSTLCVCFEPDGVGGFAYSAHLFWQ